MGRFRVVLDSFAMAELENIGIFWVALGCIGMDELGSVDSLGVEHNIQIKRYSFPKCYGR